MNKKEFETLCNLHGTDPREKKSAWKLFEILKNRKNNNFIGKISKAGLMKCAQIKDQRTLTKAIKLLIDFKLINNQFEIIKVCNKIK